MQEPSLYEKAYIKDQHFPIQVSLKNFHYAGSIFNSHWHEVLEILYFTKGTAIIECGTESIKVRSGDVVVINANELHRGESIDNEVVYYCIDMSTELLKGNVIDICEIKYIEPIVRNLYRFENKIQNDREVVHCIENIITEFESGKPGYELAVKGSTYHLLTALLRRHIENILTPEECNHRQKMFDKLKNALIYIENRYTDKLTLEVLAEQCGFSVYHFCHEFKKAIGKSPGEYITLYRIAKAEELLLNSDMSITDIALSTGFNDANYFSRAFRKYKEDSPSAYRKKNLLDR
jgi:AraC-like DNA-binding protein/mannose-6-phosphate isomerase-like protein (cupin superfamily)